MCTYNAFRIRWPDGTIIQNEFKNECNCDFLNVPNFRIIQKYMYIYEDFLNSTHQTIWFNNYTTCFVQLYIAFSLMVNPFF